MAKRRQRPGPGSPTESSHRGHGTQDVQAGSMLEQRRFDYLWSNDWASEREGPFTLLAKFAVVNGLDDRRLVRALFGAAAASPPLRGRSLLMTRWMGDALSRQSIAGRLQRASLGQVHASWCSAIAGDENFRYCPTCLANGFAAAAFQIDALVRCPIHADLLLSNCQTCSAPTPPYAVCRAAFSDPMRCTSCKATLARGWDLRDFMMLWKAPRRCKMLMDLDRWCDAINHAGVDWRGLQDWPSAISAQERRVTAFHVLRQIVPLDVPTKHLRSVPLRIEYTLHGAAARVAIADPESAKRDRRQIYKSIRRHFARVWAISLPRFNWPHDDSLITDGSGCILTGDPSVSIFRHGFHLWRSRFESWATPAQGPLSSRGLTLCLRDQSDGAELFSDPRAWAAFVLTCLRADCASALQWNLNLRDALPSATPDCRRLILLPLVQEFADHLSPRRRAWPAGVTVVSASGGTDSAVPSVLLIRESWGACRDRGSRDAK